jgi:uncharacterized membrane protein
MRAFDPPTEEGKTVAILSYLTVVGWLVALNLHARKKSKLGAFHLRQSLGIWIIILLFFLLRVLLVQIPKIGNLLQTILALGLSMLWLYGLITAAMAREKTVPFLGKKFQHIFSDFAK